MICNIRPDTISNVNITVQIKLVKTQEEVVQSRLLEQQNAKRKKKLK